MWLKFQLQAGDPSKQQTQLYSNHLGTGDRSDVNKSFKTNENKQSPDFFKDAVSYDMSNNEFQNGFRSNLVIVFQARGSVGIVVQETLWVMPDVLSYPYFALSTSPY